MAKTAFLKKKMTSSLREHVNVKDKVLKGLHDKNPGKLWNLRIQNIFPISIEF